MANFLKEEIEHFGSKIDSALEKMALELNNQRSLTKADIESLIATAAKEFGSALDLRIEKAKTEASDLISAKLIEFKTQLSEAADKQKKAALQNAAVGVVGASIVGVLSILLKSDSADGIQPIDIYRTILICVAAGYFFTIVFRLGKKYFSTPDFTRNSVVVSVAYLDLLKPRGLGLHLTLLLVTVLGWIALNYSDIVVRTLTTLTGK